MKIAIRADGGNILGMGHIMRTLSLAKVLKKRHEVFYICSENVEFSDGINKIKEYGFEVIVIQDELELLKRIKADLIIVDKYGLQKDYFKTLKTSFSKVMYIDDFNMEYPEIDIILNQNIGANESKYVTNEGRKLLLGTRYALLREEFAKQEPIEIKRCVEDVMITMGGADPVEFTKEIVEFTKKYEYLKFHIVIGSAFKDKEYYKKLNYRNVSIYNNPNMVDLMKKSDIAISAAGSTLYEFCKMGIPTLSVVIADNQVEVANKFNELGIISTLGWFNKITSESFVHKFSKIADDANLRKNLSNSMVNLVDGNGCNRVCEEIEISF